MKKKIVLLIMMSLITNCGYNSTHTTQDSIPGPLSGSPDTGTLDFATVKAQVLAPFCLRCHSDAGGNRGGINLETFANVSRLTARIQSAVNTGFMPPSGPLEANASSLLNAWIQAGAPEMALPDGKTKPAPGPVPSPLPTQPDCGDGHGIVTPDGNFVFDPAENQFLRKGSDDHGGTDDPCDKHKGHGHG